MTRVLIQERGNIFTSTESLTESGSTKMKREREREDEMKKKTMVMIMYAGGIRKIIVISDELFNYTRPVRYLNGIHDEQCLFNPHQTDHFKISLPPSWF